MAGISRCAARAGIERHSDSGVGEARAFPLIGRSCRHAVVPAPTAPDHAERAAGDRVMNAILQMDELEVEALQRACDGG
jgi:hypothetical protein